MALHLDPEHHGPEKRSEGDRIEREELRPASAATALATGSMICPACELPIAVGTALPAADPMSCPFCDHTAPARAFLRRDAFDVPSNHVDLVARFDS